MLRLTLLFASVVLLSALALAFFISLTGRSLDMWVMFVMQGAVIGAVANTVLQMWRLGIRDGFGLVPRWSKVVLPVLAVTGAGLMATNLLRAMPSSSPSGQAVSSYSANTRGGECVATYNRTEVVVVPMEACEALARTGSFVFVGGWLLFGAAGLWLALLVTNARVGGTLARSP